MRLLIISLVILLVGASSTFWSCRDDVRSGEAEASTPTVYDQVQDEVERKLSKYPRVQTLRAYWAEAVRHALATAGYVDTVDLDSLIRKVAKSTSRGMKASMCPIDRAPDRRSLYEKSRPAVTRALESIARKGSTVHEEDVARIVVASTFVVMKTGDALCREPSPWRVLFPE